MQLRRFIIGSAVQFSFFLDRRGICNVLNPDATDTFMILY